MGGGERVAEYDRCDKKAGDACIKLLLIVLSVVQDD